jgi:transcriptional regulator with XRE-family HTH domain
MTYGEWLGARMSERRISQRQLAWRAGVNHGTVSRILAGRAPTLRTFTRLARIVGWPPIEALDLNNP